MSRIPFAAGLFALLAGPGLAEVKILDPYARVSSPVAKAGAAYMVIENLSAGADRLLSVSSPAAMRVELHSHSEVDGVMRMREIEAGLEIPAGGAHRLRRGGDHVMFMGLSAPWAQGDLVPLTLVFEQAGAVTLEIPVDLDRAPEAATE